ncbi:MULTISPECIES: ABC transporter permease [Serratia]|uniref:ABC transporter permease n=1 Tax=Serratia TaxID=613 RepID=UPI00074534E9|nr:ABC transporter permease [Serratia marcescens]EJD6706479.1 ABC transporter permease [Serratia marcescens]EME1466695.1 ABC transporter permease [Serratia marcescens]MBN3901001.1 ABC transporter permease [Serratia marcescens]MBN3914688.1 ABC transporter permease [Serratia marcescens]MBN3920410.1 ABC transporter permease [Serratia marcescens]
MNIFSILVKTFYRCLHTLTTNKNLVISLSKRDIGSKYKGSFIGLLWSFINPVLMMVIYTFVFSVVFKIRWGAGVDSKGEFALALFIGLIFFGLFSECINRAPSLIVNNVNYVKKVVFPVETLPLVSLLTALFQMVINLIVWSLFYVAIVGLPTWHILWLPVIIAPFLMMVLGVSWFLSSLGVYLKDIAQVVGVLTMILMYLSPIFYPISMLPDAYHIFMQLSPLTYVIEQARDCMMLGKNIAWGSWGVYTLTSFVIMLLGYGWFMFTRKGFADVI